MTFIINNIWWFLIPAFTAIFHFALSTFIYKICGRPEPYRPPLTFREFGKRNNIIEDDKNEPEVDPDLIQYWPGLFTNNNF